MDVAVRRVVEHPEFASRFKHRLKFNGTEFVEERLSVEEQHAEVSQLASGKFHVFLERYGSLLPAAELRALEPLPEAGSAEARFWFERLLREPLAGDQREKQRRRRRWAWARREMARPDGFFSEDEMKQREPQLFHRLVGKHLDTGSQLSAPMQGSLSTYLMQQLDKECQAGGDVGAAAGARAAPNGQERPSNEQEASGGGRLGEERKHDDDFADDAMLSSGSEGEDQAGDGKRRRLERGGYETDDVAVRMAKFLKAMRDRFVSGREPGFDYSAMDSDSDLDDLVELGRDAEDKYFADDDGD